MGNPLGIDIKGLHHIRPDDPKVPLGQQLYWYDTSGNSWTLTFKASPFATGDKSIPVPSNGKSAMESISDTAKQGKCSYTVKKDSTGESFDPAITIIP